MAQTLGDVGLGEVIESVLGSTEDGIFVLNRGEEVVIFNRACEWLTGLSSAEVLGGRLACDEVFRCHRFAGRPALDAAPSPGEGKPLPEPREPQALPTPSGISAIFRARKERAHEEILLVSRSGERRWVETSFSPVLDAQGDVLHTVGVLRIVDERKRVEAALSEKNVQLERALSELQERTRELVHAEKMAMIGQLAAGVAHELNTPLNTILGYSQLIAKRATDPEIVEEARAAEQATKRCRDIVRSLLDFSRRSDGFRAPRRLSKVIERALDLIGHDLERRGVKTALALDPAPLDVVAAEDQLEQALLNLTRNALDAMPRGGTISVRTAPTADRARVEVVISDTGHGMAPDTLARAFEPFFTTKSPGNGTGLGLPIVQRIVEELGGAIEARSEPGRGSTFTLRLPLHSRPGGGNPLPTLPAEGSRPGGGNPLPTLPAEGSGAAS